MARNDKRNSRSIQLLGAKDLPRMRELLGLFGRAFEQPDVYGDAQPGDTYLSDLLGSDTFLALVALRDGEVVGGLAAYVLPKFEQARREIFVYDLAVDEDCRRQGVGTALLTELRRIAAARGAYVIFVQADVGDDPAIGLYDKLGAREEVLHFDIDVEGG